LILFSSALELFQVPRNHNHRTSWASRSKRTKALYVDSGLIYR
jgi:hypothetical protein